MAKVGTKLPGKVPVAGNASVTNKLGAIKAPKLGDLPPSLPNITNRFVSVRVSVPVPSNSRRSQKIVERSASLGGASINAAKASVVLFDPKYTEPFRNIRSNLTQAIGELGLKTGDGTYVVHASKSKQLIEMGVAAEKAYRDAAREFVDNYDSYVQEWAHNLGQDYDPKLYPAIEKVANQLGVHVGDPSARKRGFAFTMKMVSEVDNSLERDLGLSLTDDEREFLSSGARAHYQSVVDEAFAQLRSALSKIVEGDKKGRRVRKETTENANKIANKIVDMGIDNGVASIAADLTSKPAPVRTKDDAGRDEYTRRARALIADIEALSGGSD